MFRNLKALGLALVAALALGAIGAQAASADLFESSDPVSTVVTAEATNTHKFEIWGGDTTCEEATFKGTVEGETSEFVTVHPEYNKCTGPGGALTIDTEGCFYKLGTETSETEDKEGKHAEVTVECLEGHSITIRSVSTGCHITVHAQGPLHGVTYENGTTTVEGDEVEDVTIDATVTNIHYTTSFICTLGGLTATDTDGKYFGKVTAIGYDDTGEPEGSTTGGTTFSEGTPINIHVNATN